MSLMLRASTALLLAGVLAGCAADGTDNLFTTGALGSSQVAAASEQKIDPACVTLASRIEALRREGVLEKIEKAAAKKYKMTQADLVKVDQLTKSNAEYQLRCSTIVPVTTTSVSTTPAKPQAKAAAKAQN